MITLIPFLDLMFGKPFKMKETERMAKMEDNIKQKKGLEENTQKALAKPPKNKREKEEKEEIIFCFFKRKIGSKNLGFEEVLEPPQMKERVINNAFDMYKAFKRKNFFI